MNYSAIINSLSILPQDQALKVWFFLDLKNLDCFWNEDTGLHYFKVRDKLVPEIGYRKGQRAKIIALLEKGIEQ